MLIRSAIRAFAGAVIITICAFGQIINANTFTTTPSSSFPPVGIGTTETVQVILSNTAAVPAGNGLTPNEPAPSCSGSVTFYNSSGAMIGTATSFTLTSGQITQVSLPYASAGSASVRALIRAVVSLNTTFPGFTPCSLSYSLAIFDTVTGVTHAIVTGAGIFPIAAFFRCYSAMSCSCGIVVLHQEQYRLSGILEVPENTGFSKNGWLFSARRCRSL